MFKADWNDATFAIKRDGAEAVVITVNGRQRWALECLIKAGPRGCTPILNPAPRWAAYVQRLRCAGVAVETIIEPHVGLSLEPMPGTSCAIWWREWSNA